jgi:hypothetical protein
MTGQKENVRVEASILTKQVGVYKVFLFQRRPRASIVLACESFHEDRPKQFGVSKFGWRKTKTTFSQRRNMLLV